jgi:PAS domain S-box-containing protein
MVDPSQQADGALHERQQAELLAGESELRFRRLLDNLPIGAYTCDADGLITYFNDRAAEFWGREPKLNDPADRFCGSSKMFSSDGTPIPHNECWMALALRDGKGYNGRECTVERPDGSRWVALVHVNPLYDTAGRPCGAMNVLLNITDTKRVESAVKVSEVRYRRLFEAAKDGILILDADTAHITDANPFIAELLGYSHADLIGKELWQIGLFKDVDESKAAMRELQQNRYIRYEDMPLETKTGRRIDVEFVSNVYSEDQQSVIQCNIRDITERRRLEDKLRQVAVEMSEADRRKNEFLAMLAHELRNPLAPIRNALQIMRLTGGKGAAVTSASEMMERQVSQMVRLVDDLLDVSRISRGKIELRRGRIELASAVNHAVEAIRSLAQSMEHDLIVTLPPQPMYLNADPTRLAQVVGNLLNNACKFTDKGGRISLTVEREDQQAVIRVWDNGIGIAAEQLPLIFNMFMQIDTSLERSVSGLGIGLMLVKNLVEMHDGTVEVYSAGVGHGSEFVVRLPIMLETPSPLPPEPVVNETTTARRILIVDDNRDAAASLAMLLKITGNETHTANDGLEAVEAVATFRPEIVLLDIGLPKLNGYEACRRIREQPWGKNIVIVALTGWGQEEDREKSKNAGFDGHMVKPIDFAALRKLLAESSHNDGI